MEYYSAIKNEQIFAVCNLEGVMLSEITEYCTTWYLLYMEHKK